MLRRAASVALPGMTTRGVWGGTFHAMANRVLRVYGNMVGLDQNFTIMDRSDAEDLLNLVRNDLSLANTRRRFPQKSTCMDIYSRRVNGDEGLEEVLDRYFPWCSEWLEDLKGLFREYVERKATRNTLDYDDLLLYWYHLLQDNGSADMIGGAFDHVLVDEYQDTNRIQAGILSAMRQDNQNITVVGDDAQSIYSFRSATVKNMLEFPQTYPGTKIVTLEQNYRSVEPILITTNRVIEQAEERHSKEMWSTRAVGQRPRLITCRDEAQQDEIVIQHVLEHREQGILLRKQAVLFRAASHSASLELALARRNIPYRKYGGLRFLEAAHIKDVISLLRIVENPRDETAWFRILQLLPGVGPTMAAAAYAHIADHDFQPMALGSFRPSEAARDAVTNLQALLVDLMSTQALGPAAQVERACLFYAPVLEQQYDNVEARRNDLEHLCQLAAPYLTLREFLAELILDPPVSTGDLAGPPVLDEDWLVLSTIHSAKGLEWDAVYLIHGADGCLPSDMATGSPEGIEEELRLMYVAMTRARDFLYVTWPKRYYHMPFGVSDN